MKTLGQIGYESTPDSGGMANFGPWKSAPAVVRDVHERTAKAIRKEVLKREGVGALRKRVAQLEKQKEQLLELMAAWDKLEAISNPTNVQDKERHP